MYSVEQTMYLKLSTNKAKWNDLNWSTIKNLCKSVKQK